MRWSKKNQGKCFEMLWRSVLVGLLLFLTSPEFSRPFHFCLSRYPSQDTDDNILENNQDMNELKEQMVMLSGLFNQMRIQKFNHTPEDASKVSAFGLQACFFNFIWTINRILSIKRSMNSETDNKNFHDHLLIFENCKSSGRFRSNLSQLWE